MKKILLFFLLSFLTVFVYAQILLSTEGKKILEEELNRFNIEVINEIDNTTEKIYNKIADYEKYSKIFVEDITDLGSTSKSIYYMSKDSLLKLIKRNSNSYENYIKKMFEHHFFNEEKIKKIIVDEINIFNIKINEKLYTFIENLDKKLSMEDKKILENDDDFKSFVNAFDVNGIFKNNNEIFSEQIINLVSTHQNSILKKKLFSATLKSGSIVGSFWISLSTQNPIFVATSIFYTIILTLNSEKNNIKKEELAVEISSQIEKYADNISNIVKKLLSQTIDTEINKIKKSFNLLY
ncbi:hypothetical protein Marpi_0420 [Marinitoga piezophila KA3]|uniref:Uncharacterized protein n=1 Tax=Marinitoga piezophila (strain DSM 14283 / JCM 11233 / KA3) TaxID=443254 RepID=H2J4S9_MARPK|nr:hypothetical protein [Marinitoga piezophila]AEX84864.1 hypothetical protein Marpi_0420 [Marinitoga piezophila KA3]